MRCDHRRKPLRSPAVRKTQGRSSADARTGMRCQEEVAKLGK
jgi:hypothetical protein